MRLFPRRLVLEAAPETTPGAFLRLAARLAGHLGWVPRAPREGDRPLPGAVLARPATDAERAWRALLPRARSPGDTPWPSWLDRLRPADLKLPLIPEPPPDAGSGAARVLGSPALVGLRQPSTEPAPSAVPRVTTPPEYATGTTQPPPDTSDGKGRSTVLLLTTAANKSIRRDPRRALAWLTDFASRHPGADHVHVEDEVHLPEPQPLASLIAGVRRQAEAAPQPNPGPANRPKPDEASAVAAKSGNTLPATARSTAAEPSGDQERDTPARAATPIAPAARVPADGPPRQGALGQPKAAALPPAAPTQGSEENRLEKPDTVEEDPHEPEGTAAFLPNAGNDDPEDDHSDAPSPF